MAYEWYVSRSKRSQFSPRITLCGKSIGFNKKCTEEFFKGKGFVVIGYDRDTKNMIFIPKEDNSNGAMKLVNTAKSKMSYLKADKLYQKLGLSFSTRKECDCSWDETNKGVVVSIK